MLNHPIISGLIALAWLGAIIAGFAAWEQYDRTPGANSVAVADGSVAAAPGELVMFLHPRCPCSQASLNELLRLVATLKQQNSSAPAIRVEFVLPDGVGEEWEQSPLRTRASSIPGVRVGIDRGGCSARKAGVRTSGHVVVRDERGGVLFSGGITPARGRSGPSAGASALSSLLGGQPVTGKFPVYGCPLFDAKADAAGEQPCR